MGIVTDQHILNSIRGQMLTTIAASRNRDDLWKLADEIATDITAYIKKHFADVGKMVPDTIPEQTTPVDTAPRYQTGQTTDAVTAAWLKSIDDELAEPVAPSECASTEIPQPSHSMNEFESVTIEPMWTEWDIDWNNYDLSRYSNPCTVKSPNGDTRYVETELWLVSKDTGELKTCDARFASETELRIYCDPLISVFNSTPRKEYIDTNLDNATQKLQNACRDQRKQRRLDQFIDLWEQYPGEYKHIAEIMGVSVQTVYSYKNLSKARG